MSTAVVSTSAALGRSFFFDGDPDPHVGTATPLACPERAQASRMGPVEHSTAGRQHLLQSNILNQKIPAASITPASRVEIRPAPEMASSGISAIDVLTGGLPRGCLTEICGSTSSGRTTVLLAALAAATRRGEFCVVVDASDTLDPQSVAAAGVDLDQLLWVRCGDSSPRRRRNTEKDRIQSHNMNQTEYCLEQALRAADLLLESGGFGLIALDLGDLPVQAARRIPLTTWFRFRRAVEYKPTILLSIEQQPVAGSCSSLLLQLGSENTLEETTIQKPTHAHLLTGLHINAEFIRSRLERKPAGSVKFVSKTAWAG